MNVVNPCSICAMNPARFTCMLCGRLVCENCYEPVEGICKMCAKIPKERRMYGNPEVPILR